MPPITKKLDDIASELRSKEEAHFLCVFDDRNEEKTTLNYWANIGDDEACMIIETLVKNHGGEMIDRGD